MEQATQSIVHVTAAVIFSGGRYLLACRPPGKVYAGYWEFPGGKVETGETEREALIRELREELGITATHLSPWICRTFTYPHARVRIKFFRVHAWQGTLSPLEHSAIEWVNPDEASHLSPMLPANTPVLKSLALPPLIAISSAEQYGVDRELEYIRQAFAQGTIQCLQIRDKNLPPPQRSDFARQARALTLGVKQQRSAAHLLLINDDFDLARQVGADGIHLSAKKLLQLTASSGTRPDFPCVGASCHNLEELQRAEQLGVDFVVLGPVLPTPSHPDDPGIGWQNFAALVENLTIPVYAIGGLDAGHLAQAIDHGAHGIAMLRGWRYGMEKCGQSESILVKTKED